MINKQMNTNNNEKEISLVDAVGLLQQQVKALVKVIKQNVIKINILGGVICVSFAKIMNGFIMKLKNFLKNN